MRGKAVPRKTQLLQNGITPAYAGKSGMGLVYTQSERDHPRLCGEKDTTIGGVYGIRGSPPPMRGKEIYT